MLLPTDDALFPLSHTLSPAFSLRASGGKPSITNESCQPKRIARRRTISLPANFSGNSRKAMTSSCLGWMIFLLT